MLPKKKRLTRALFKPLMNSREQTHSPHFWLKATPAEVLRFGVSVSKKVAKSAVVRNRIRRRVYVGVSHLPVSFKPGHYLVVAKAGAQNLKGSTLLEELGVLFRGIKV